jgi:hypothetical protein
MAAGLPIEFFLFFFFFKAASRIKNTKGLYLKTNWQSILEGTLNFGF